MTLHPQQGPLVNASHVAGTEQLPGGLPQEPEGLAQHWGMMLPGLF